MQLGNQARQAMDRVNALPVDSIVDSIRTPNAHYVEMPTTTIPIGKDRYTVSTGANPGSYGNVFVTLTREGNPTNEFSLRLGLDQGRKLNITLRDLKQAKSLHLGLQDKSKGPADFYIATTREAEQLLEQSGKKASEERLSNDPSILQDERAAVAFSIAQKTVAEMKPKS